MKKIIFLAIVLFCFFSHKSIGQNLPRYKLIKTVKNAPDSIGAYVYDIVDYFQTKIVNEKELVILFTYWIYENISYDVDKYMSGCANYTSIMTTLDTKKTLCQGYSELLCDLCYWADINCETINGYAKGFGFEGKRLEDTNHVWNAVFIENKWELIDITWASGFLNHVKGSLIFKKEFRKEFMFAKPDFLISTHFPIESKWQLLNNPINIETFFSKATRKNKPNPNIDRYKLYRINYN